MIVDKAVVLKQFRRFKIGRRFNTFYKSTKVGFKEVPLCLLSQFVPNQ